MIYKNVPTYILSLLPSRIEKFFIVFLYSLLGITTLFLPAIWGWPVLLALTLRVGRLLIKKQKYIRLMTQQNGTLLLEDVHGNTFTVAIQSQSVVYPFLIVLQVKHVYKEYILLWSDSVDKTSHRQLRIWLCWYWPVVNNGTPSTERPFSP